MATPADQTKDALSFGPFNLIASERLLTRGGAPVELGGRALDILIALMSAPNEVVSKKDLMRKVWPDVVVEEGSLRFHMASLRKALGDGKDGARYITTLAGRGYCFVAPIARAAVSKKEEAPAPAAVGFQHANLPVRLSRMLGRDADVLKLSAQLTESRFVTVVGAGGVGKTTVAVAVAHHMLETFKGAALFVDLGMLSDPSLVSPAVSSMLGLSVRSEDPTPGLIAHLRDKKILLIFDTCEHLIEIVAALASRIFRDAPHIHILATSREALQVEGEHVYKLDSLDFPPEDRPLTGAEARAFPAMQLFVERAVASGARLDMTDAEAAIVADICRRLDGVPLAIELAARRVEAYGLEQTAALLDQRLRRHGPRLEWHGPRGAQPRQRTLQATIDWSFGLLSDVERAVLRQLAVFVGNFTLDAALAIAASKTVDQQQVLNAIDSLVAKSMLATRPIGAMMRYRLLDTTRAYALDVKLDDTEAAELAARHATYYRTWLEQTGKEWPTYSNGTQRAPYFAGLNNVRAALEWCFGETGNIELGVRLAAAAAPVFLGMALLPEGYRWSERAVSALGEAMRGGTEEMHLQAVMGVTLMFTRANSEAARTALNRSLEIAEARGEAPNQLQLLNLLHIFHHRVGDFKSALDYGKRSLSVAEAIGTPAALCLGRCLVGSALHHAGQLASARENLEAAVQSRPGDQPASTIFVDYEHYNYASAALARTLWLQGYPAQAVERAGLSVEEATATGHPVAVSRALIWAIAVFLWAGHLDRAAASADLLISHAEAQAMGPYMAVGGGYKGAIAIRRGEAKTGVENLRRCLEALHAVRYELLTTTLNIWLAEGLAALGRLPDALALVEETIQQADTSGNLSYMPELLRMKGRFLLSMPKARAGDAEAFFMQSLEWSRRQGARALELRTATDLAALWAGQGRTKDARGLLQPVFKQFTEGADTADVKAAAAMLAKLH